MFPSLKPCGCVVAHCNCSIIVMGFTQIPNTFTGTAPMTGTELEAVYLAMKKRRNNPHAKI